MSRIPPNDLSHEEPDEPFDLASLVYFATGLFRDSRLRRQKVAETFLAGTPLVAHLADQLSAHED